jgi:PAS domain S-box-containing protein
MDMRHKPRRLGKNISRVINRDETFISHLIVGSIVTIDTYFSRSLSSTSKILIYIMTLFIMLLGAARYFNLFKIKYRPATHLIIYHVVAGLAIIFFAKVGSIYPFVWLIMLFLTNYYYGRKMSIFSLLILVMVIEMQLYHATLQEGIPTKNEVIAAFSQIGLIAAISLFFVDSQAVSEKNHRTVINTMAKAQMERQRLTSLINSMTDGVIATDTEGVIKLYNAAALNVLDTNADLSGKHLSELMDIVDTQKNKVDIIKQVAEKNTFIQTRDYLLKYSEDELINLALNISPIKLGYRQNADTGYILTFRDITREKSLEEERNEFVSVISHELRTPVTITEASISNLKFLMAQSKADPAMLSASVEAAHKQVIYLANMLNDLSTLSRAERGKLELEPEPINPVEVLESLFADYKNEAAAKGLKLKLDINKNTPTELITNKLYMREILQNFITNSIKYTAKGSVTLSSERKSKGVMYRVTDTGIGISKSDQKKVFDKFFRSEDYRTRESSGTGLGLYVTMKLCKLLQAKISLKSQLNKGSEFSIFIPDLTSELPKPKQSTAVPATQPPKVAKS